MRRGLLSDLFTGVVAKRLTLVETITCWFPCGTEPVFPPRSEPPLSMVF